MYIPFENLPPDARIWIYQANHQLTDDEANFIEESLKPAINQWAAHGVALLASVKIFYHRFIVIALNEKQYAASGCSIDSSTRWLKDLGEKMSIDFFDRSQAYLEEGEIKTFSVFQAKKAVENGIISPDTIVFLNNGINTIEDILEKWKEKAANTYLKRYFSEQTV
jgi:hypothetical protein